jgi:transposase-like protein
MLQNVLEGMARRANISEVCRRHGISSTAYDDWRAKAPAGMKQGRRRRRAARRPPSDTRTLA